VTQPTLYLVFGRPGAGKSTRAQAILAATKAVHISPDEWIVGLGVSLVDYDFRFKLQDVMLAHAGSILRAGASVVVEFGSWSRDERESIRRTGAEAGAATELHYLDAPMDELARRVRARGGPDAESLVTDILIGLVDKFEPPTADEISLYDRYIGPDDPWEP
jgi:predicted kinase